MKPTNKFSYSFYENTGYFGEYNSIKEALEAAREDAKNDVEFRNVKTVYIGRVYHFEPNVFADGVVEQIQEDACDEAGEVAEDYLENISLKDLEKLGNMLTETFNKWATETDNEPNFYTVEEVQEYSLEE